MPGFNRKGPEGNGPMTGRAMGRCSNKGRGSFDNNNENKQTSDQSEARQYASGGMGRGMRLGLRRGNQARFSNQGKDY